MTDIPVVCLDGGASWHGSLTSSQSRACLGRAIAVGENQIAPRDEPFGPLAPLE